ncbi:MAG TPA: hypothetical protein P5250_07185, partial [Bacteroidales bacterium]|nr:hypothetical protein [Bacteroidales bacterium]
MIIKNYNTKNKISLKKNIKILLFIFLILIVLISGICIGIKINQNKIVKSLSTIKQDLLYFFGGEILTDIKNYYNSHKANPEVLIIDIKQKYYDRLAYNRQIAMQRGLLLPSERDEVPATITWRGTKYQVKMRLKGDMPDHWTDEKKWSFRISVKGDNAIMGMKNFSIQSPETRGSLNEWLYHKFLNYIGLISLRYDFVSVKLNGTDLGIYALEE